MTPDLGLYVHVPFCEVKCAYCAFAIDPRRPDDDRQERYLRALLAEIKSASPAAADTLYFGGGTPSLLAIPRLGRIIAAARRRFHLPADAEVTIEVNPHDLDDAGYRELRALGVNRLQRALAALLEMNPEHVSVYLLEVEGKTALAHRARQGRLELPEDDLVADLYHDTRERLGAAGIARYEISNFARPGRASRHNAKYWDDAPFLGFGMSAHSYRDGRRFWNLPTYGGYCAAIEAHGGAGARAGERQLGPEERAGEALFTGLRRRDGVETHAFAARYGVDPLARWAVALEAPFEARLVEVTGGRLRLTDRGLLVSNEVFRAFV